MGQNYVDDLLILYTGYDLCRATTMRAGFYRAAFGSMLNTLFNRCAQVGELLFEVLSISTDVSLADDYYVLPAEVKVVDMNEKVEQAMQKGQEIIQQSWYMKPWKGWRCK